MQKKSMMQACALVSIALAATAVFAQGGRSGGPAAGAPPAPSTGAPDAAILGQLYPGVVAVSQQVAQSARISFVAPEYPAIAKQAGVQGQVWLGIQIGVDGRVAQVNTVSGPATLYQPAMDAVAQWVYRPTNMNGQPVPVATFVVVNFTLL